MKETVAIDHRLLRRAVVIGGLKSQRETVHEALREFVLCRERRKLIKLFGTIDYDQRYNHKRDRKSR